MRAVFFSSYRNLDPDAARLFRLFGVHPGHDIDAHALTALAGGGDPRTTRRLLDTLTRAHLVDETTDRRYVLHDLLATYAAELTGATDTPATRTAALTRLLDHYVHTAAQAVRFVVPSEVEPSEGRFRSPRHRNCPLTTPRYGGSTPNAPTWSAPPSRRHGTCPNTPPSCPGCSPDTSTSRCALDEVRRLQTTALDIAREQGDLVTEGIALRSFGLIHMFAHQFERGSTTFRGIACPARKSGRTGLTRRPH